jgi:hypothetical protein
MWHMHEACVNSVYTALLGILLLCVEKSSYVQVCVQRSHSSLGKRFMRIHLLKAPHSRVAVIATNMPLLPHPVGQDGRSYYW